MELFSEIYSTYYDVVKQILVRAASGITEKEMKTVIEQSAYAESGLYILPRLLDGRWKLLEKKEDGKYYSSTGKRMKPYLSNLQLSYLKAVCEDQRIGLFLTENQLEQVKEQLKAYEPLFQLEEFHYYDQFLNGDRFTEEHYRDCFALLLTAVKEKRYVKIVYGNSEEACVFAPVNLEYSAKNNKFRLAAVQILKGKDSASMYLNLEKIEKVVLCDKTFEQIDIEKIFTKRAQRKWILFEIYNERNALERCTLHFSHYEKHIEYCEEKKCWECRMYYERSDETEILIGLLSFGPVLKVLEPSEFVEKIKWRLYWQRKRMS